MTQGNGIKTGNPTYVPDDDDEDEIPDNQETLNEDRLEQSVDDLTFEGRESPEDAYAEERDHLKAGVKDMLPGPQEEADELEAEVTRNRKDQFDPRYFDIEENPDVDKVAYGGKTDADVRDEEASKDDPAQNDPDIEQRIG